MGVTLRGNGSPVTLDGGYGLMFRMRAEFAKAWDPELGAHYATLADCVTSADYKSFDAEANRILSDGRFEDKDRDLAEFLFASDSEGSISHKTCKKLLDLIGKMDKGALPHLQYANFAGRDKDGRPLYSFDPKGDWDALAQLLKHCWSHRARMRWS